MGKGGRNKDGGVLPPIGAQPPELGYRNPDKDPNKKVPKDKLDVPAGSPTLSTNPDMLPWVRDALINQLDDPKHQNDIKNKIPGLKNIKPRPNFRLDDKDHKEKPRDVYEFEYEKGSPIYMNKKDGSLWVSVDPTNEKEMGEAIDRMLEVANQMGMTNGVLCIPGNLPEGPRQRLQERAAATAERLGMSVRVTFGDPRVPPPPKPPGPQLGPSRPSPGPALVPPGAAPK